MNNICLVNSSARQMSILINVALVSFNNFELFGFATRRSLTQTFIALSYEKHASRLLAFFGTPQFRA